MEKVELIAHGGMTRLSWPGWLVYTEIGFLNRELDPRHGHPTRPSTSAFYSSILLYNVCICTVWPKNGYNSFVHLNFINYYFTVRIRRKLLITLSLKIPPHLKCVAWNVKWLSQRFIDRAVGQWRRRLECVVQQQGGHNAHLM